MKLEAGAYVLCLADAPYGSKKLHLVVERWGEVAFAPLLAIEHPKDHDVPIKGKS